MNFIFKKIYCLVVVFFITYSVGSAQKKDIDIERGDCYFSRGQYVEAIKNYQFAYKKHKSAYILDQLASCYIKINEYSKAEVVLGLLLKNFNPTEGQILKYAKLLQQEGKVVMAKEAVLHYLESNNTNTQTNAFSYFLSICDSISHWKHKTSVYNVSNAKQLNTQYSEISPVQYKDSLVFASNREHWKIQPKSKHNQQPYFDLYITGIDYYQNFSKPKRFSSKNINSFFHESSASFAENGLKMYYTQCSETGYEKDSVHRMKLYASEKKESGWSSPHTFIFNDSTYSFAHPSVDSANKMIFFVSDMKGGYGGTDIYVSIQVEPDVWSDPINLGPVINTPGNETYPFYHGDGKLYFSSDYHPGLGGYDIFVGTQKNGDWMSVSNLCPPINSTYDDIGIYFNKDKNFGYFSSNRLGGKGGEDIYLIRKK